MHLELYINKLEILQKRYEAQFGQNNFTSFFIEVYNMFQ